MSIRMNAAMLKSNESTIQPRNTAQKARHCVGVTSRSDVISAGAVVAAVVEALIGGHGTRNTRGEGARACRAVAATPRRRVRGCEGAKVRGPRVRGPMVRRPAAP